MFAPNNPYFALSEEGKAEWGDVFPDGKVPIATDGDAPMVIPEAFTAKDGTLRMCAVDWQKLTSEQQHQICVKLASIFDAVGVDVRKHFDNLGLHTNAG